MCFTYTHSWETCRHKETLPITPCAEMNGAHTIRTAKHVVSSIDLGHPEYPCPRCISQAVARQRTNLYFARPQPSETTKVDVGQRLDREGMHSTDDPTSMKKIGINLAARSIDHEGSTGDQTRPELSTPTWQPTSRVVFRTHALEKVDRKERSKSRYSTENTTLEEMPGAGA